jgi:hypothetical protein
MLRLLVLVRGDELGLGRYYGEGAGVGLPGGELGLGVDGRRVGAQCGEEREGELGLSVEKREEESWGSVWIRRASVARTNTGVIYWLWLRGESLCLGSGLLVWIRIQKRGGDLVLLMLVQR